MVSRQRSSGFSAVVSSSGFSAEKVVVLKKRRNTRDENLLAGTPVLECFRQDECVRLGSQLIACFYPRIISVSQRGS